VTFDARYHQVRDAKVLATSLGATDMIGVSTSAWT